MCGSAAGPRCAVGSLRRRRGWSRSSPRPFGALPNRRRLAAPTRGASLTRRPSSVEHRPGRPGLLADTVGRRLVDRGHHVRVRVEFRGTGEEVAPQNEELSVLVA
ncbi:hypothetical protein STSP_60450 [Streptomyces jeddahensis]|uniref:Uncharacterized protein n=1 Tax=Streptomyces jeddahensis TaxID=1716141 RepID=A0A177HKA5_9ACTN|nr:hypothetical protein STSP_60450 [Streptomyces jeddahensis]